MIPYLVEKHLAIPTSPFFHLLVNDFYVVAIIIVFVDKNKLNRSYFSDQLTFSNIRSRTSCQIYRLALPLYAAEMLSSLSRSKISVFNMHLTSVVQRMTQLRSHNSIGKYRNLAN